MTSPHQTETPQLAAESPSRNTLGIVALIIAAVGAVFACIPGALIVGWVLLPTAFILGLVSLFLRGKRRGTGIAAVIVSVIGTVVGVVVFLTVVADAFDESFSPETTAEAPDDADGERSEDSPEPADEAEDAAEDGSSDAEGTRENPLPLGTEVSSGDWTVTVNSVDLDATDDVLAENQFNEAPEDGQTYILVSITAEYIGSDSEGDMPWASVEYVSPEGNTFTEGDAAIVAPEAFDSLTTLYEGASETGNVALQVPADDVASGVLAVTADMFGDTVFVSVS